MNLILIIIISLCFLFLFLFCVFIYIGMSNLTEYVYELSSLVSRTFREFYKGEDMEPIIINNGVDIIWKGDVEGTRNENNKQGFITIMTNEGNINSPIKDHKEADIIAGKIIRLINEYLQDD